jgi:hypothetical protein
MTDAELWHAFHARTLPAQDWTHEAHLRIAYMYMRRCEIDEAHLLFRIHLIRLNTFHEVPEAKDRGYHDTLTRGWLIVMADAIRRDGLPVGGGGGAPQGEGNESLEFMVRHPEFQNRRIMLNWYSRDRINSVEARARWVDPDLGPMPHALG